MVAVWRCSHLKLTCTFRTMQCGLVSQAGQTRLPPCDTALGNSVTEPVRIRCGQAYDKRCAALTSSDITNTDCAKI